MKTSLSSPERTYAWPAIFHTRVSFLDQMHSAFHHDVVNVLFLLLAWTLDVIRDTKNTGMNTRFYRDTYKHGAAYWKT